MNSGAGKFVLNFAAVLTGVWALAAASPQKAIAQTVPIALKDGRELISLSDGQRAEVMGGVFVARGTTLVAAVLSSELATIAVIEGKLQEAKPDGLSAAAGEALVMPIESRKIQRFAFDAAGLAATLRPEWVDTARPRLQALAQSQAKKRFWGRLRPARLNASAPGNTLLEESRRAFLTEAAVVALRRESQGDRKKLRQLTAKAFANALVTNNPATLAALIDPASFATAHPDSVVWKAARLDFAQQLLTDTGLRDAAKAGGEAQPNQDGSLLIGALILELVDRDRASFIAAARSTTGEAK